MPIRNNLILEYEEKELKGYPHVLAETRIDFWQINSWSGIQLDGAYPAARHRMITIDSGFTPPPNVYLDAVFWKIWYTYMGVHDSQFLFYYNKIGSRLFEGLTRFIASLELLYPFKRINNGPIIILTSKDLETKTVRFDFSRSFRLKD